MNWLSSQMASQGGVPIVPVAASTGKRIHQASACFSVDFASAVAVWPLDPKAD
jgi:hypothetical protein